MNLDPMSVPSLAAMINDALSQNASDINISVNEQKIQVLFAIYGQRCEHLLSPAVAKSIVDEIQHAVFAQDNNVKDKCADAKFDLIGSGSKHVRVRLAWLPTLQGHDIIMKLLNFSGASTPLKLEDLGYSEEQIRTRKEHQSTSDVVMAGRIGVLRIE